MPLNKEAKQNLADLGYLLAVSRLSEYLRSLNQIE